MSKNGNDDMAGGDRRMVGSLRQALAAAARSEGSQPASDKEPKALPMPPPPVAAPPPVLSSPAEATERRTVPSAAQAVAEVRAATPPPSSDTPQTRAMRPGVSRQASPDGGSRTQLVRGKTLVKRTEFHQDPVVAWLVVIGGPGLGAFRPIFEGNNTVGRSTGQRVPIDFGDETISSEEQAYIRYDSVDRRFLLVPNLAKTNIVAVNDTKPTSAVELNAMDVISMGHTQLVFVPFCGQEFDWAELSEMKG
ncbi:MAG: FHA domain-containing protein [Hyphomicrobiaceae bacterium]